MSDISTGDRVFVYSDDDGYYYSATVRSVSGDQIKIRWDAEEEGDADETVDYDYLDWGAFEVGDDVECWSDDDEDYYDATVVKDMGEKLQIRYDEDDSEETVTLDYVRYYYEEDDEEGE